LENGLFIIAVERRGEERIVDRKGGSDSGSETMMMMVDIQIEIVEARIA
jgi:hypothetical protein